MKKLSQLIYQKRLAILTVIVFIFPVFPLILLSIQGLIMVFSEVFFSHASIRLSTLSWGILSVFWFLGGPAGLIAMISSLLGKYNKITLLLYLYAAVTYTIVALPFIITSLSQLSLPGVLFSAYLLLSLVIIAIQIVKLSKKLAGKNLEGGLS